VTIVREAAVTEKGTGIPTSSTSSDPVRPSITPTKPLTNGSATLAIKHEPVTPSLRFSPSPAVELEPASLSLDDKIKNVADVDPDFAAASEKQKLREIEEAKLICSLDNKEACVVLWLSSVGSRRFRGRCCDGSVYLV
jgi:ribonucleoside-diphosphate reductase subunit M1